MVCSCCHVAVLEPHPELQWWHKCPVCGFCSYDLKLINPQYHEAAKNDPMSKKPHLREEVLYKKTYKL